MPVTYVNTGYSPKAGVWYPEFKTPIPRVYHKFLRLPFLKQIYRAINFNSEEETVKPLNSLSADSSGEDLSGE